MVFFQHLGKTPPKPASGESIEGDFLEEQVMTDESKGRGSTPPPTSSRDEMVRKRAFQRAKGVDINSFMVDMEDEKTPQPVVTDSVVEDIAVGEISPLFTSGDEESTVAGAVQSDGSVEKAPEMDSVTDLAVHGEKRLSLGLLVAMVFIWSAFHGHFRVVSWRTMDSESKHETSWRNLGYNFDEIILWTCSRCMALGLV